MKTIKYLMMGALMLSFSAPVMAQDNKAIIQQATQAIKAGANKEVVKQLYKDNKKNAEVLVGIGRAFLNQNDTANAKMFAQYANQRDGKYAPAYILLGDICVRQDNGGGAAGWYQQAKYFDPKNPEAYYKYANILRGRSPQDAVDNLNELRVQRPDVAVDALCARIWYRSNRLDKCMEYYDKVEQGKLEDEDITNYAMAGYLTQQREKSLQTALYGLSRDPRKAGWNRLVFYNYTDMDKFDDALTYANRLFNASDSAKISGYDYTYLGTANMGKKNFDAAIEAFTKAIEANGENKDLQNNNKKNLSDAYLAKEDYANAIKYYEEYLANNSQPTASDLAGLGTVYQQQASGLTGTAQTEAFKKADGVYQQLGEKFPANIDFANFMRARINSYMDPDTKQGLAKPFYEALANSLGSNANRDNTDNIRLTEAYRYLGYYYLLNNDKATADSYWNKVLAIDPENETAKQALGIK